MAEPKPLEDRLREQAAADTERHAAAAKRDTTPKSFTLPTALVARLEATAEERMVGASLIVAKAIEEYLDTLAPLP